MIISALSTYYNSLVSMKMEILFFICYNIYFIMLRLLNSDLLYVTVFSVGVILRERDFKFKR